MTVDYRASLKSLRKDPKMAALVKRHGKPDLSRYHGAVTVFESLLRSIIYQQLSGRAAGTIHGRVLVLFPSGTPTPQALLKIRAPLLRKAGLSKQKITYVRDLAAKCIDGTIDEKRFPEMTSEEIIEHLVQVKGIGVWTAHMMLIFRLHRLDILPVGDLAIRKGFERVYALKKAPSAKDMEKLSAAWRAHASVASWYLWREMDSLKKQG
ncbi:DNA-3-methyladenine glycosylase 2 family protein [Candidatus Kaiserbacteria bacterium]|nr:DNA-3-methyladenine glycosylase 2 family protein [Candidatus Kaiserbacteria bacterium]